jgi:hypothetical protein
MNDCIRPPALTLAQLSALIDGDADPAVRMHVEDCPSCRQRAAQLAVAQERLHSLLWRITCPVPEQLRDYAWNLLSEDETMHVAHHVAYCPYCTHDLFYTFYAGDTTGDDLFTQAARRLGSIEYCSASRLETAPVSHERYAGAGGEAQLFAAGDGVLVSMLVLRDEAKAERWVLEGAVSGTDTGTMQAHLWLEDQLLAAEVLDAGGDFRVSDLAAGTYHLVLHGTTTKWWLGPVRVGVK